jgi:hypothetical protein
VGSGDCGLRIADCGLRLKTIFGADRHYGRQRPADRKMADRKTEKWHFLFFCLPFFCLEAEMAI